MNGILNKILFGGGLVFDLAKWLIVSLIIIVLLNTFLFSVFVVDGESMEPNLHDKELVLWNKLSQRSDFERGDVVVMNYPGDPENKKYVKRVIGLPNETVQIKDGRVFINKNLLDENYLSYNLVTEPEGSWKLAEGQYILLGDNRPNSSDSRVFGSVEKRFILGKAAAIIFPRIWFIETP